MPEKQHQVQDQNRNKTKTAKGHTNNKQSQTFADTFRLGFAINMLKSVLYNITKVHEQTKNPERKKLIYIQGTPPQFFLFIIVCLQFLPSLSTRKQVKTATLSYYSTITNSYLFKPHYCSPF